MALLFLDGFDHYTSFTDAPTSSVKWTEQGGGGTATWTSTAGRVAGTALRLTRGSGTVQSVFHTLTQTPGTIIIGFACRTSGFGGMDICNLYDITAAGIQVNIQSIGTGQIRVYRGPASAQLGSDSAVNTMLLNTWHYIEVKAIIATGTGGSVGVWVDNNQVLNITGVNTQATANAFVNRVYLGSLVGSTTPGAWDYDDFYCCDTTTGLGNSGTPLGDSRVITLMPSGNSGDNPGHDQWTQVGGTTSNFWTSVNEIPEDGDTSYVSSATVGQIENFTHAALPATITTVKAVQFNLIARKDDVGTRQIAPTQRNSTTDSTGTTSPNLTASYIDQLSIAENSLQTGIAWTVAEINASEFGVKVIS